MKLFEIIEILEKAFPKEGAYEWDNIGLLVGDENAEIAKVFLTLDITEGTIKDAVENHCQLILSHHPMMFTGIKQINTKTSEGRIILSAIKHGINIYTAHTNCDVAPSGINAYLAELFQLEESEPLEESGLGRIGKLKKECTLCELCEMVKSTLKLPALRVCGNTEARVKTVAIGSGACSDSIPYAIEKNADVMITGDTKYHNMLDYSGDIAIIDAGHYGTEIVVCDIFTKLLRDCPVELIQTSRNDVYKFI